VRALQNVTLSRRSHEAQAPQPVKQPEELQMDSMKFYSQSMTVNTRRLTEAIGTLGKEKRDGPKRVRRQRESAQQVECA